jgi:hypothetical protein
MVRWPSPAPFPVKALVSDFSNLIFAHLSSRLHRSVEFSSHPSRSNRSFLKKELSCPHPFIDSAYRVQYIASHTGDLPINLFAVPPCKEIRMPTSITHYFSANVSDGPSLVATDSIDYEAYELIRISVPPDNNPVVVNLSADSGALLLAIASSVYENIEYDVDGGQTQIVLDGPHLLIGEGIIALLGAPPGQLTFRKDGGVNDAEVTILVGRDATP